MNTESHSAYQLDFVSLFPDLISSVFEHGVISRAVKQQRIEYRHWNPRDFTTDSHRTVDDRPFGGGPGMVMLYQPLCAAIEKAKQCQPKARVIYLTPQGRKLDQQGVMELAQRDGLIIVAGRYEAMDERVIDSHIDEEWSIGDYVLSGGELAAMVMVDAVCRTLPGVLGHESSASQDSFVDGLLDYPHYTRPENIAGLSVPEVLLSGNHAEIQRWRMKQALGKTWKVRPDLLESIELNEEQQALLDEFIAEYQD